MAEYQAHPTAIIDSGAQVGAGSRVWHWVHICGGAVVGMHCSLGQNVFVGNRVRIGNNVKIQNNVSVYDNVTLEDDVFCGPSMVFTNVYNPRSVLAQRRIPRYGRQTRCDARCQLHDRVRSDRGRTCVCSSGCRSKSGREAGCVVVGVPARQIGWMSRHGDRLDLPMRGRDRNRWRPRAMFTCCEGAVRLRNKPSDRNRRA